MSSIKKNFVYNSAYQILQIFIPLITIPYITRILGAEGIGIYSYNFSISNYFVLFIMLGVNNYGNREIAKARENKNELSQTFWSIYALQLIMGGICSCIYLFYCITISSNKLISFIMISHLISGILDINWYFFGLEKFKFITIRNIVIKIITTMLLFLLIKDSKDIALYCLIMVLSIFISQLILWPSLLRTINFYKPTSKEISVHIKPNLYLFLTVLAVSLFKIMDKIMLGVMKNTTEVGYYESAEKIISIPTALITSLGTVMLPRMTNLVKNKSNQSSKLIDKSIIFAMLLSTSMSFGIMGVADVFVPLFYGKGYDICVDLYIILLPSCIFLAFANVVRTQFLLPNGMDKDYIISAFLGAAVNLLINTLSIPHWGAIGAAIGTLIAEAVVCVYQCAAVRKYLPIKKYVLESLPIIFAGFSMFILLRNIKFDTPSPVIELVLLILFGAVIYSLQIFIIYLLSKKFRTKRRTSL